MEFVQDAIIWNYGMKKKKHRLNWIEGEVKINPKS